MNFPSADQWVPPRENMYLVRCNLFARKTTMKLWTLAIVFGLFGNSIAQGDDAKDVSFKAWGKFTGKWKVTVNNDETFVATIRKSECGSCFIHENRHLTHVVGWDAERKMLRGTLFFADGGHGESLWKVTGDAQGFAGNMTFIGDDGKRTETTGTFTFTGPDRWEGKVDGTPLFKAQRIPK